VPLSSAELDALVDRLTLEEQVSLLSGVDNWHTADLSAHGVPPMRVTDGPAGARGTTFTGPPSVNVPSGTALAATFDPDAVERIGELLGRETRAKGARVLLAPTVNLHRTPVGGRNFECQSEDPYLSARITVGYVRGVQSEGVAACVKHFVGNDTEFERMTIDNQIDERTLRELYLQPFEAAVREADAQAIMTAYNRINGPFAADSKELLTDILRGEWGFDGIVMSDWFGLHSTVEGIEAGLDLEMPGPTRDRGAKLVSAVQSGAVDASLVRDAALRMLSFMDRLGSFADGGPGEETTRDVAEDRELIRSTAAAGMVLLRNEDGALPLDASGLRRVAVIGPNASKGRIMGGGSAMVNPVHEVHPLGALRTHLQSVGVEVVDAVGCTIHRTLPPPRRSWVSDATIKYFASTDDMRDGAPAVRSEPLPRFNLIWPDDPSEGLTREAFACRISFSLTPDVSGPWTFGLTSVGRAVLSVDGVTVVDDQSAAPGGSFFGIGKAQETAATVLEHGKRVTVTVEYINVGLGQMRGLIIGLEPPAVEDTVLVASKLAATCDVAIVVVGTNDDWEAEGYDRSTIALPGRQDELIAEVAKVSARTIVVINAGSPVAMPWINDVDAVLFVWFPGQEFGDALTDVLTGDVDPGGRLPVTLPRRLEDSPAFEHAPGRNGVGRYLEGRLMGYRFYDTVGREPLFPFGHGLSYAHTSIDSATFVDGWIQVSVTNTGTRTAVEVVQVYAHDPEGTGATDDPTQKLVGFAKVHLVAGESKAVKVSLDPRWAMHWDVASHAWTTRSGERELRVGRSSRAIAHVLHTTV
jgi:beta-glucosidase